MINKKIKSVTAFAPATCGNAIVGFDIIGLAISGVGDEVTLIRRDDNQILIKQVMNQDGIPTDPQKNIASAVVINLVRDLDLDIGFDIVLNKGIPLSSGMGGSAASAVAALTACNSFLNKPLSLTELAHYALQGEALCSGQAHADNIVPAFWGGITLITQMTPMTVIALPIPDVMCVLVHPQFELATKQSRQVLSPTLPMKTWVTHSAHLAGFISALYQHDLNLLADCLQDVVIEPQRQALVPGFSKVKSAALEQGALGASLSGAGPSVLAFARDLNAAHRIGQAMQQEFKKENLNSEVYISSISPNGASIRNIKEESIYAIS